MRLTVESYNAEQYFHVCRDADENLHQVDLLVYGSLKAEPESLIGKVVECDYLYPTVEIAWEPRLVEGGCGVNNAP